MIKKTALIILFVCLGYQAMSCKCVPGDVQKTLPQYNEIFVGKLIGNTGYSFEFLLLKSWKGTTGQDTLRVVLEQTNSCYRNDISPQQEYFLLFVDSQGVFNCSPSGFYDDSHIVEKLDEWLRSTVWINKNYEADLARIEYDRKFILQTSSGDIDIKDKQVIWSASKDVHQLTLPIALRSEAPRLIVLAAKPDLTAYASPPDYILYLNNDLQPKTLSERKKQKVIKRTMRKFKRAAL